MQIRKTVSFKRLEGLDLVIPSRRHGLRMILDNAAAAAGFILKPRLEVDTLSAVCEIVAATEMVTVLPGIALTPLLSAGRIRAQIISRPAISRAVGWVTNPRRVVSGAASAVMEIISADLNDAAKAASRTAGAAQPAIIGQIKSESKAKQDASERRACAALEPQLGSLF